MNSLRLALINLFMGIFDLIVAYFNHGIAVHIMVFFGGIAVGFSITSFIDYFQNKNSSNQSQP